MKQLYLLLLGAVQFCNHECNLYVLVEVVSGSFLDSFNACFSQNGLLDGQTAVYYSVRCRSFKKALMCLSEVVHSAHYVYINEIIDAQETMQSMITNVGKACAVARHEYCSANYLEGKMKSCTVGLSTSSLNNLTEEYAYSHYTSLVNSLNCMTRELQICPDDELVQTYLTGIQTWRSQLDQLAQAYQQETTRESTASTTSTTTSQPSTTSTTTSSTTTPTTSITSTPQPQTIAPRCVKDCKGLPNGDYQSCRGCSFYVSCSNGYTYDGRACPGSTVWNDDYKFCDFTSTTCH